MSARLRLLGLFGLLTACGDPLAPTTYRGTLLLEAGGRIFVHEPEAFAVLDRPLRAGLFWATGGPRANDREGWIEQISVPFPKATHETFAIRVYAPLPPALQVPGADYGLGRLLVYDDRDQDGWRDPGEPWIALLDEIGWFFAARDLTAAESPTALAVPAGYHRVGLPLPCDGPILQPGAPDCDALLGAECVIDADCGGAECFDSIGQAYDQGVCALALEGAACVPAGAAAVGFVDGPRYAVRGCRADADCPRAGYRCDLGLGACRSFDETDPVRFDPTGFPDLALQGARDIVPWCADSPPAGEFPIERPGRGDRRPPRPGR